MTMSLSARDFQNLKSALDEAAIVAITDRRGHITYVNKKFCAISKYPAEELVGKTHRVINSGLHSKEFFIEMWKTIASGKVWEGEIRNRAKDGSFYWVYTTIVPFLDASGQPESYVSVRYEITDRVVAQEQLKVHAKKLEVSNRELEDFASVAAHDLQEPLRKIQSFSGRLHMKAKDILPPDMTEYLLRMQNSANRMQTLINDLLTYSRVTTRAQPFVPIDLNLILDQVLSDLENLLERNHASVSCAGLPVIEADPTQMRQLFQNLLSNAAKFHKPGERPAVTVKSRPDPNPEFVRLDIQDNGIGFDEKYLDRIFTIFQRLHGRSEYEGTGIGLAVCRKIADRHAGEIFARSEPGKGSCFTVRLPIRQKPEV
jgi:PAS domain S-box-containing protein